MVHSYWDELSSILRIWVSLVWHAWPWNPDAQKHAYMFTWSTHLPPFWQGLLAHSSISEKQIVTTNIGKLCHGTPALFSYAWICSYVEWWTLFFEQKIKGSIVVKRKQPWLFIIRQLLRTEVIVWLLLLTIIIELLGLYSFNSLYTMLLTCLTQLPSETWSTCACEHVDTIRAIARVLAGIAHAFVDIWNLKRNRIHIHNQLCRGDTYFNPRALTLSIEDFRVHYLCCCSRPTVLSLLRSQ